MSLLKHNTIRKKQVEKTITQIEFKAEHNKEEFEVKGIQNNAVYIKESEDDLLGLYYLILWKVYFKEENI